MTQRPLKKVSPSREHPAWTYRAAGLRCEVWPTDRLPATTLDDIAGLYLGVVEISRANYQRSLASKDYAVAMYDRDRRPVATLCVKWHVVSHPRTGTDAWLIGVHHAAILPAWRGRNIVQASGLEFLLRHRRRHPWAPTWWVFTTYSHRSYLGMARNFPRSWPTARAPAMPPDQAAMVDSLMSRIHPHEWDRERGVLRWPDRRLVAAEAEPDPARVARDPDLAFFVAANPGYASGDCLVCLADLSWTNLARAAWLSYVQRPLVRRIDRSRALDRSARRLS